MHFAENDRNFPRLEFEAEYRAPSKFKNEQKLPKIVYIIPNILVLHFGENFVKIRTNSKVTDA